MSNKKKALILYKADTESILQLLYADQGIKAGFPSPAQDYLDQTLDLNKELIKHPATTFLGKADGDSMKDAGVTDGDILIIDKSLEPKQNAMAVCYIDGEFTVKYIKMDKDVIWLIAANEKYSPIRVTADNDFLIWGFVTYSIKRHY